MSKHIYHSGKETLKLFPSNLMNLWRHCVRTYYIQGKEKLRNVWAKIGMITTVLCSYPFVHILERGVCAH